MHGCSDQRGSAFTGVPSPLVKAPCRRGESQAWNGRNQWPEPADSDQIKEKLGTKGGLKAKRKEAKDWQPTGISEA